MSQHHYNTTNESGQILIDFNSKSKSQEEMIWDFFITHKLFAYTWAEVQNHFPEMNECSLKRAITNLKNEGKLEKTSEKGVSKYGRPAYKYKLAA